MTKSVKKHTKTLVVLANLKLISLIINELFEIRKRLKTSHTPEHPRVVTAFLSASSPPVETPPKRSVLSSQRRGQGRLEPSAHLIPRFLVCLREADPSITVIANPPLRGSVWGFRSAEAVPVARAAPTAHAAPHVPCTPRALPGDGDGFQDAEPSGSRLRSHLGLLCLAGSLLLTCISPFTVKSSRFPARSACSLLRL